MRRLFRALGVAALLLMWALPAHAAELTGGCVLEAKSFDGAGNVLDDATGTNKVPGSTEGTETNPFRVAWDGKVDFHFVTPVVFQNNSWEIFAENIPTPIIRGSDDNPLDRDELGNVVIGNQIPGGIRFVGLFYVNGALVGNDGADRCQGNGWVHIIGDPTGTIPFWIMLALIALGIIFLIATPYTKDWEEGVYTPMPNTQR